MGAFHEGHVALFGSAREECEAVVVSLFVNPTQFGPNEDFARYPRAFESDVAALRDAGVAVVYAPDVATMYPPGFGTEVDPGPVGSLYEGARHPHTA